MSAPQNAGATRRRVGRLPSRHLSLAAVVALGAVLLSGCLGSGYAYVSHRNPDGLELYFKVPTRWKIFNDDQIVLASNPNISRSQISQIEGQRWIEAFSMNTHTTAKHALQFEGNSPDGFAYARPLDANERQGYSLSSLRSEVLGTDPLSSGSPDTPLSYTEFTGVKGVRGSRMTVDVPIGGGKYATYEQIAEVDAATNWVFLIGVGCTATCWRPNEGLINQVLDSWSIKAIGR